MADKGKQPSPPHEEPRRIPTRDEQPKRHEIREDVIKVDPGRDWPDPPPPRQEKDRG